MQIQSFPELLLFFALHAFLRIKCYKNNCTETVTHSPHLINSLTNSLALAKGRPPSLTHQFANLHTAEVFRMLRDQTEDHSTVKVLNCCYRRGKNVSKQDAQSWNNTFNYFQTVMSFISGICTSAEFNKQLLCACTQSISVHTFTHINACARSRKHNISPLRDANWCKFCMLF